MISLVRVDDRLVHGQVTVGWAPYLEASEIVVASDRLARNKVLTAILKAGGPSGIEVVVIGIDETVRVSREKGAGEKRVILLFESLEDVQRALDSGLQMKDLNLGGLRGSGEGVRVSDAVFLCKKDQDILHDLRRRGVRVDVRIMPADRPRYFSEEESP